MPLEYHQTNDKEILDKVRNKRRAAIQELKNLNFEEHSCYGETAHALGFNPLGLSGFLGVLVALFNEVSKVERNLDVTIFNMIMTHRNESAYAGPFGLGVKFYTSFTDGTFLITANFETPTIADINEKIYKFSQTGSIAAAWAGHTTWVDEFCVRGRQRVEQLSLADFIRLSHREDDYLSRMMKRGW